MAKRPPARRPARQSKRTPSGARKRTSRSSRRPSSARTRTAKKAAKPKRRASKAQAGAKRRAAGRTETTKKVVARRTTRARRSPGREVVIPSPPSSLDLKRRASAARSGRDEMAHTRAEHTESSPALTAGDVDADWATAYSSGDEAPGGDMPTPDQGVVEDIGAALGVGYADDEELRGADKIEDRDRHRWELDPASADDYEGRAREEKRPKRK